VPWRQLAIGIVNASDRLTAPPARARRLVVSGCEGEGDTTIFLLAGAVAAIVSDKALRAAWADGPRRRREGLEALLDFIVIPRDEAGRPIIPQSRVTALLEARDAWASELGTLDAVTRSITRGQLVMPRISAPSQQKALRNHRGRTMRTRRVLSAQSLRSGWRLECWS
jgi:hypothetical protein